MVVLNYVKPPKPAPVTVEVRKYTCDPGFKGQFYLDFINACGASSNLTNGVQVRLAGVNGSQIRFTGDTGQLGLTRFTQLAGGQLLAAGEDSRRYVGLRLVRCPAR